MAEGASPIADSMESMPPPSQINSGSLTDLANGGEGEPGKGGGEGEVPPGEKRRGSKGSKRGSKELEMPKEVPPKDYNPKNCCQKCCGKIMSCFANDAIYGSWVGPHPVSFLAIFKPCRKCIAPSCAYPLLAASIATKIMNFIMFGIITILASFFIFPWPESWKVYSNLKESYPCDGKIIKAITNAMNDGCEAHAGYFMAYRCFLAFAALMATNFCAMIDVTSTSDDPYRKKIHHGFWMYKYIYLFVLLLIFFLFLKGDHDPQGYFEFTVHIIGNFAHAIFTFFEMAIILDIVEIWVVSVTISRNQWSNFMYRLMTCLIFLMDIIIFTSIFTYFAFQLDYPLADYKDKAEVYDKIVKMEKDVSAADVGAGVNDKNFIEKLLDIKDLRVSPNANALDPAKWHRTNCLVGSYMSGNLFGFKPNGRHFGMICGTSILAGVLIVVMFLKRRFSKRYPFQGWMQVAVILLFNVFYLWSALYNSSEIYARPHCNWALHVYINGDKTRPSDLIQSGNIETYFRYPGFIHGALIIFALIYFAFVHGPRSKTAPFSLGYRYYFSGGYDRIPVIPNLKDCPPEFKQAVQRLDVWDDEQERLAQSWSSFYLWMLIGALSMMMAMTNFTDPWGNAHYNTSDHSVAFKYLSVIAATAAYIFFLICPCTRVYRAYETPVVRRRIVKKQLVLDVEKGEEQPEQVEVEEEEEYDDEVVSIESVEHQPEGCGCMF